MQPRRAAAVTAVTAARGRGRDGSLALLRERRRGPLSIPLLLLLLHRELKIARGVALSKPQPQERVPPRRLVLHAQDEVPRAVDDGLHDGRDLRVFRQRTLREELAGLDVEQFYRRSRAATGDFDAHRSEPLLDVPAVRSVTRVRRRGGNRVDVLRRRGGWETGRRVMRREEDGEGAKSSVD